MINSGTLTFAAECLTDSDSEAEVVPSEVASANKRTFKALLKTCFLSEDHQRQQVLKNCQEASEDSETGSSNERVPASEHHASDQVLEDSEDRSSNERLQHSRPEDSEDRSSDERLQHSRLEDSEDQVPKNPEDQKFRVNISSFQGLEVLKISAKIH